MNQNYEPMIPITVLDVSASTILEPQKIITLEKRYEVRKLMIGGQDVEADHDDEGEWGHLKNYDEACYRGTRYGLKDLIRRELQPNNNYLTRING